MSIRRSKLHRSNLPIYLFLLPAILLLLVFLIPTVDAFRLALTNEELIGSGSIDPQFIGLLNFSDMFSDANFYNSVFVTLMFLVLSAWLGQLFIGLGAAGVLRSQSLKLRWLPTAAIMMTMAVPETAAAFMWASILVPNETGIANLITSVFGADPINWTREYPIIAISLINVWRGIGMAFILLAAGFEAIGNDVREAATVDGAAGLKLFLYITLPILAPTILLFLLLTTVGSLGTFGFVYFLTGGGPARSTEVISVYIYKESFAHFQLGYGAAVGVVMLILSTILGVAYLKLLRVKT
ncbi:MAG: sugar ABC transporter permease [Spirochaetales bacterium]|nr:sugar ABC transporter permease [Spirochaetales bacterium]